jgi:hypothetical protein
MSIVSNCTGDAKDPRQAVEKWTELHCPLYHSHYYYLPSEPELFSLEQPVDPIRRQLYLFRTETAGDSQRKLPGFRTMPHT